MIAVIVIIVRIVILLSKVFGLGLGDLVSRLAFRMARAYEGSKCTYQVPISSQP